ncbi:hypothetical protein QFZ52_000135 [Arthrobacter woluwensis]|uniref:heparin lyase I family protein n=1 Tax=Arthrobacter woluwensis TaxID=156980 RepID=UPI00278A612F|nr:heparin lyase I family protein [Arthrobacter woluwensis]MDQ0707483.1 hypothetical protein [Arthrobacter woluwensis]
MSSVDALDRSGSPIAARFLNGNPMGLLHQRASTNFYPNPRYDGAAVGIVQKQDGTAGSGKLPNGWWIRNGNGFSVEVLSASPGRIKLRVTSPSSTLTSGAGVSLMCFRDAKPTLPANSRGGVAVKVQIILRSVSSAAFLRHISFDVTRKVPGGTDVLIPRAPVINGMDLNKYSTSTTWTDLPSGTTLTAGLGVNFLAGARNCAVDVELNYPQIEDAGGNDDITDLFNATGVAQVRISVPADGAYCVFVVGQYFAKWYDVVAAGGRATIPLDDSTSMVPAGWKIVTAIVACAAPLTDREKNDIAEDICPPKLDPPGHSLVGGAVPFGAVAGHASIGALHIYGGQADGWTTSTGAVRRGDYRPLTVRVEQSDDPKPLRVAWNRSTTHSFSVTRAPASPGAEKIRSEGYLDGDPFYPNSYTQYDIDYWVSYWLRLDSGGTADFWEIFGQWHPGGNVQRYLTPEARDAHRATGLYPVVSLGFVKSPRLSITYRSITAQLVDGSGPIPILSDDDIQTGVITDPVPYAPGTWTFIVLRTRFSTTGGGSLDLWRDGTQIAKNAGPVGYNVSRPGKPPGPTFNHGIYAGPADPGYSQNAAYANLRIARTPPPSFTGGIRS